MSIASRPPAADRPTTLVAEREIVLHGHRVRFLEAGAPADRRRPRPVLLLVHGITSRADGWRPIMELLARDHHVLAPDLLGHGGSAKPRGDYSLGAYASGLRDLVAALGHDRVSVAGHSLGGGVAMQFAYQFPERTERLALISSGGLGREVSVLLRAAALPGAELVLPLLTPGWLQGVTGWLGRAGTRVGIHAGPDLAEAVRGYLSLGDPAARSAFLHTLRAVVDPAGQRVSGHDRLYLAADLPTLVVWGERDPIIPVAHGREAHAAMPGSRLEVFAGAGHFPYLDDPVRFASVLHAWLTGTTAAELEPETLRERLLAGAPARAA
jgi:pimeloyl-ACP methyl ester carboxylesterase